MNVLWISDGAAPKGTQRRSLRQTPSLSEIALQQLEQKTYDAVVLDCRDGIPYSMPHILSASALLRAADVRFCILGGSAMPATDDWLLRCDGSAEAALAMLQKGEKTQNTGVRADCLKQSWKSPALAPLQPPPGTLLMVDVLGSQARIGCTTQSLQLYHYFATLGFHPAIIISPEQASVLQRLMEGKQIGDTLVIDSVTFVTSVQGGYDCFIHDDGCIDGAKAAAAQNADYCVLVAGIKPWEVSATVAALTSLRSVQRLLAVASYGDEDSKNQMQALMQKTGHSGTSIAAPWQPNPFKPTSLGCYETIRPILETMLKEEELCV